MALIGIPSHKLPGAPTTATVKVAKPVPSVPAPVYTYAEHLQAKPVTAIETVEHFSEGKPIIHPKNKAGDTQTLHPGVFTSGMSISVEGSRTLNLGNYESAKIGVSINVPCESQTLTEAYEWASNWVSERINEAVKDAQGQ